MKSLILVLLTVFSNSAHAAMKIQCHGNVMVRESGAEHITEIFVMMTDSTKVGTTFGLGSPITEDTENGVTWEIIHSEKSRMGTLVTAKVDYDGSVGETSRVSFDFQILDSGKIQLMGFRGFEGSTPFGPSDITDCSYN